jgi:hypothetical protein
MNIFTIFCWTTPFSFPIEYVTLKKKRSLHAFGSKERGAKKER